MTKVHSRHFFNVAGRLERKEKICELAGIPHTTSSLQVENPIVNLSALTNDEEDLQAQISQLNMEIHRKFLKVDAAEVLKSLRNRITMADLVHTLLMHCTVFPNRASILQEHSDALKDAKSIDEVFLIIAPYYSYFNYELLQSIIDLHGFPEDKERMWQYVNIDFSRYCNKVPCVEIIDESPPEYPKAS